MKIIFIVLFLVHYASAIQQDSILIRNEDRIRIAEAINISENYGNKIWKSWDETPFAILLVTDHYEFLINHPEPTDDFILLGYDTVLNSNIYYREIVFGKNLLAAFPAVNGISTIVAGIPENTGKSSIDWTITLLHEHFHQLQDSQSDYYAAVESLNLSNGDQTGMWMLNYPFAYAEESINSSYDSLKKSLVKIFKNENESEFSFLLNNYKKQRKIFNNTLNENDYKYFSFQVWKEGIARYTEIKFLQNMIEADYKFTDQFKALPDLEPLHNYYDNYYTDLINLLNGLSLHNSKRNCFYSYGAFEGLLLDRTDENWRDKYFSNKFYLEKNFTD